MKLKECSQCNQMVYLWKSNPKLCKSCAMSQSKRPILSLSKQRSPSEPIVSKVKIKSVSDKRLLALKEYRVVRDAYMRDHKICEFPDCNECSTDLHHKKPRAYHLCDVSIFMAVCRNHHTWIHDHDAESREMGLLMSGLSK